MSRISIEKIYWTIQQAVPKKIPGPDRLPNLVFQQILLFIEKYLYIIFNTCLDIGYCFQYFCRSITVVLRKLSKDNYTVSKSYQPIVLLSTIDKTIESIVAFCISYFVKKYIFFPEHYIKEQRGRSCNYILYLIYKQIYTV